MQVRLEYAMACMSLLFVYVFIPPAQLSLLIDS